MLGWLAAMFTVAIAGREAMVHLDPFQVMELRSVIGILMLYPLVYKSGGLANMKTGRPVQHIVRNIVHYGAQYSWFLALTLIPLAQVISIEFTLPIWTALFAMLFLGEKLNVWRVAAIVLGFAGVLVIVRPETGHIDPGQFVALAAAFGFGISVVLVKSMTRTEPVVRIIFWMLIIQSIIGLLPAWQVWKPVPAEIWGWVVLIAFCGTFSHYCMAQAMTYADATIVVPMDFIRVPLAALAGWVLYEEALDVYIVTGAIFILLANLLNLKKPGKARAAAE